jgi:hypothetical protein
MSARITPELLHQVCGHPLEGLDPGRAFDAACALGDLAAWCLPPRVLDLAAGLDPTFAPLWERLLPPADPGACTVLFVKEKPPKEDQPEKLPLLRPAFLLPLVWRADTEDDRGLPPALVRFAEQVRQDLAGVRAVAGRRWGLHRSGWTCDLGALDGVTVESGWAPLAAGLWLRAHDICPRPGVLATGRWNRRDGGVAVVEGLADKLAVADEWRDRGVQTVFVPAAQKEEATAWKRDAGSPLEVGFLDAVEPDLVSALRPYLARLGAPPTLHDSFEARTEYFRILHTGTSSDYYLDFLLPDILRDRRAQVASRYPGWRPVHFVTIISKSPELALLGPQVVGAQRCLLLHTPEPEQKTVMARVRGRLEDQGLECRPGEFATGPDMAGQLKAPVAAFLRDIASAEDVVFDLTPGNKLMTRVLEALAPAGSWLVYLQHDFRPDRRADPGSEWVVRLPAGESPAARLALAPKRGATEHKNDTKER